ncbi:MAG: glycosyltransferase family 4 protein [Firmicutes bacterium]|nr:glycosyltransferase family 4 protein [Bacillota bacterium]
MTERKVLQVITLSEVGGAQKVVYEIAKGLCDEFEMSVACSPGGELINWLTELYPKVKVYPIPRLRREIEPINDLAALMQLYRLMARERFDVVHCHSSKAGVLGRLAASMFRQAKVIYTVHGWGANAPGATTRQRAVAQIESAMSRLTDYMVYVCQADQVRARELGIVPRRSERVIYNGIQEFVPVRGKLRTELGLDEQETIIGTVSRLAPPKDVMMFLRVAKAVRDKMGAAPWPARFVVVGDGSMRREGEEFVNSTKLDNIVSFLGNRHDVNEIIGDFDIFALFSRWEGLPISILEAMMAGKPVVASNVGGIRELIVDGENGYLVDRHAPAQVADLLFTLVADPSRRMAMGTRGRDRAMTRFTVRRMLEEYASLYRSD